MTLSSKPEPTPEYFHEGINSDGSLKKFEKPIPSTTASIAAVNGDMAKLKSLPLQEILAPEDTNGNTPLIWASDSGNIDILTYILEAMEKQIVEVAPSDQLSSSHPINHQGYIGNTALSRAARGGHIDCVQAILGVKEVDPNIPNYKMQYPLHFAAYKRHPEVVRIMLGSEKCSTTVTDRKGRTPDQDTSDGRIERMIKSFRENLS
eukprot:CAMPEP_0184855732 /NCGR_PEP_ID=MMETSP0580-20130426/876_1 /TAXON_ID=1118495 /ORGANISM="Dactyliosolen fragilissimus" /LENGTH=205 /DNA_ID=CAMNT_0027350311 /DNA_START=168 /DNA_END=785 /DNA_ORIENTATION=-